MHEASNRVSPTEKFEFPSVRDQPLTSSRNSGGMRRRSGCGTGGSRVRTLRTPSSSSWARSNVRQRSMVLINVLWRPPRCCNPRRRAVSSRSSRSSSPVPRSSNSRATSRRNHTTLGPSTATQNRSTYAERGSCPVWCQRESTQGRIRKIRWWGIECPLGPALLIVASGEGSTCKAGGEPAAPGRVRSDTAGGRSGGIRVVLSSPTTCSTATTRQLL